MPTSANEKRARHASGANFPPCLVATDRWQNAVCHRISGLVVEYIVAIDVTRVRFPADAYVMFLRASMVQFSSLQKFCGNNSVALGIG